MFEIIELLSMEFLDLSDHYESAEDIEKVADALRARFLKAWDHLAIEK